jgi:SecD/SecF fusion protein
MLPGYLRGPRRAGGRTGIEIAGEVRRPRIHFRVVSWLRVTKGKVAAIIVILVIAVVVDGWAWISRVTTARVSSVCTSTATGCAPSDPAPSTTSFAVQPGQGPAFATGMAVTVGTQHGTIQSINGDVITLAAPLPTAPGAGTKVSQSQGFAGLGHQLTSTPSILGYQIYVHKGLDIVGGSELTIAICRGYNNPPGSGCRNGPINGTSIQQAQTETIPVLQNRVNSLGVSEATVQAVGSDQILVELPGVPLAEAQRVIGTTDQIHFATAVQGTVPAGAATNANYCAENPKDAFCVAQQNLYDPSQLSDPTYYASGYYWKIDNQLPAADVVSASVGVATSSAGSTGGPAVDISFNGSGANEWNKITTAAYNIYSGCISAGTSPCPPTSQIAIFLDNKIISNPVVISGNQSANTEITGLTSSEASTLASQINAGALPAEIGTVAQSNVGATLGAQTVNATLLAGAVGMIIVILFMIGYYRFPGLLASLALILYSIINLAAYKLIGVTISLEGLAGFVLSVGMAVDANVLIFERTRDELRHGRPVASAVEIGFRRAFPAIRDSNISTGIVCVILAYFGSDVVKGFAITLGIGVLISFVSAIFITQSLLTWVMRWHVGRNPTLYTQIHEEFAANPPRGTFDIVRRRNGFFLLSLVVIIPGLVAILAWHDPTNPAGFRLGIDFSGGEQIQATYVKPVTPAELVSTVNSVQSGLAPQVQSYGSNTYTIQTLPMDPSTLTTVYAKLSADYGISSAPTAKNSVNSVSGTIASSAVTQAIILILVSALAIALYLAYQFGKQRQVNRWRFAACTFFKLLHDVFVLLGIWAILGHFTPLGQVDSYFVTAVLTGVAFSIHDTIVVFDRIRENLRAGPRFTFDQIVNLSTVQTMTRSLNTSLTVVFVLLALVLFGGASIQGFVLALLVAIVTGTYSSIFNASTLLVAWEKARPQQIASRGARPGQRRMATAGSGRL